MTRHTFTCIDGHTCGNPVRLVAGGGPLLDGATMMERRAHFLAEYDWIRTGLMFEPRGHDMMSGSILYPPTRPDCDVAILFIETSGCLPMCGHGTIGTVTMAIENGLVKPKTPGVLHLDTPAGLVKAEYRQTNGYVEEVRITNVPSFLHAEGLTVDCPVLGEIVVDVAYGKLKEGDDFVHESIIGSLFKGRVERQVSVANKPAIIPSIGGWARQTGFNTIFIDDRDPFAHGFVVR